MTQNETTLRAKLDKNSTSLLFAPLADELRLSNNLDAALPIVENGLSRHPDFIPGLLVRAKILFDMNAFEEAESTFRKVYRRDPFNLSALRYMAEIATKLNRVTQAEQYWRILQTMDPLDPSLPELPALRSQVESRPVPIEEDPFAQLQAQAPSEDLQGGPSAAELAGLLDAALDGVAVGPSTPEFFPADEDSSVTSNDVGSAISSLFGPAQATPPLPESEVGGASPFSMATVQPTPSVVPEISKAPELSKPEPQPESKPELETDLASALDDLFGDDDVFEESTSGFSAEPVSATTAPAEISEPPQPSSDLSSALDDLFGDDDVFEEPASSLSVPPKALEPSTDLSSALDDLFGDEDSFEEPVASAPASTPAAPDLDSLLHEQLSSKSDLPDFSADIASALESEPLDESSVFEKTGESASSEQASESASEVGSALDDLFGDEDSFEEPVASAPASAPAAPDLDSLLQEQLSSKSDLPDFSADIASALESEPVDESSVFEKTGESASSEQASESASEVGSALDNLFGDEDSFEEPAASAPASAPAAPDLDSLLHEQLSSKSDLPDFSADIASALESEPVDESSVFEKTGESPSAESSAESASEVGSALDDLFGDEDSFEEPVASAPAAPDLDSLIHEQLSSRTDLPDFSADIASVLETEPVDESSAFEKTGESASSEQASESASEVGSALDDLFGDEDSFEEPVASAPAAPDLDSLLQEQLSSKSDLPDFSADIASALESEPVDESSVFEKTGESSSAESSTESASEVGSALDHLFGDEDSFEEPAASAPASPPVAPDLDSLIHEQLSSRTDLPDFSADIASALESEPVDESFAFEKTGESASSEQASESASEVGSALDHLFGDEDSFEEPAASAPASPPVAPDLDSLIHEQLSSRTDLPDFSADIASALEGPIDETEPTGFSTLPELTGNTPDLDSLLEEQLGGEVEDLNIDLPSEIEASLSETASPPPSSDSSSEKETEFPAEVKGVLDGLFADDDFEEPAQTPLSVPESTEKSHPDVHSALDELFADEDDSLDGLLDESSEVPLRHQLSQDPEQPLRSSGREGLPKVTPTLAEIYLQQGLRDKAIETYQELVAKKPNDLQLKARLAEIQNMPKN